jgi:hypothetical protein
VSTAASSGSARHLRPIPRPPRRRRPQGYPSLDEPVPDPSPGRMLVQGNRVARHEPMRSHVVRAVVVQRQRNGSRRHRRRSVLFPTRRRKRGRNAMKGASHPKQQTRVARAGLGAGEARHPPRIELPPAKNRQLLGRTQTRMSNHLVGTREHRTRHELGPLKIETSKLFHLRLTTPRAAQPVPHGPARFLWRSRRFADRATGAAAAPCDYS